MCDILIEVNEAFEARLCRGARAIEAREKINVHGGAIALSIRARPARG